MLFRIPAFPAHFVSLSSWTDAHFESEFTHFASGDFIVIHSCARFMWRCVDTQCIKCKVSRDWSWEASYFIRDFTRLPRKFIWIYHRSLVNAQRWEQSSLKHPSEWNKPASCRKIVFFQESPRRLPPAHSRIYRFYFYGFVVTEIHGAAFNLSISLLDE